MPLTIPDTIFNIIGIPTLNAMGANNCTASGADSFTCKIGLNTKKVTHITVILCPDGQFTIIFHKMRTKKNSNTITKNSIKKDDLIKVIQKNIGIVLLK